MQLQNRSTGKPKKRKEEKTYAFQRHFDETPSFTPGCPGGKPNTSHPLINAKRRSTSFCFFPFAEPVYIPLPLHRFGPDARGSTPQAQHAVAGRALCMHVETPLIGHHEGAALRVGAVQLGSLWYGCFCCHLHVDNNNSNNNNNNNNSNYTVPTMKLVV